MSGEGDMDKHQTEIFGQFTYSQSITYEDLLKYEKNLQENLENIYRDGDRKSVV